MTGWTAFTSDAFDAIGCFTPVVVAEVLGLSFILLTVVFRSIDVPAKAIIMNLLSAGAAYGLMVLVFHKGVGTDLFELERRGGFESTSTFARRRSAKLGLSAKAPLSITCL